MRLIYYAIGLLVITLSGGGFYYILKQPIECRPNKFPLMTSMMKVEIALADYRKQVGAYPTTALGLDALVKKPNGIQGWHGPYTSSEALLDAHYGRR